MSQIEKVGRQAEQARNNKRLGLIMGSVALMFFAGILAKKILIG